jgi:hypothetical protein
MMPWNSVDQFDDMGEGPTAMKVGSSEWESLHTEPVEFWEESWMEIDGES